MLKQKVTKCPSPAYQPYVPDRAMRLGAGEGGQGSATIDFGSQQYPSRLFSAAGSSGSQITGKTGRGGSAH